MTAETTDKSSKRHTSVLVVDDTDLVRSTISRILIDAGYDVSEAADGEEALEIMAAAPRDLVISDFRLGRGINGTELIAKAALLQPRARIILISGSIELQQSRRLPYPVLLKPFQRTELLELVSRVLSEG